MRPGDIIEERFELEHVAGRGGMGTVFRARDRHSGERVAVKVLAAADKDGGARFLREGALLAELRHPAIVRYVAHGVSGEEAYLAMEWLGGVDLGQHLERGALSIDDSVALAAGVAGALAAAHAKGAVHRDIKPSNLFLVGGAAAAVKVLDFGVARWRAAGPTLTKSGALVGTPAYMAPEQARAERQVDARADIFSLGCVLYECLTGFPAFDAEHLVALLTRILFEEPQPIRSLRADVPRPLAALVHRMVAKDLAARPAGAAELLAELEALRSMPPPSVEEPVALPGPLSSAEQRLVSVVMLAAPAGHASQAPTLTIAPIAALHELVGLGVRFEELPDGTVVGVLSATGVATDLVERAAAVALALRAHGVVALATGRADVRERVPMGPVIDRAVALLRASRPARAKQTSIAIDASTADLLAARFEIERDGGDVFLSEVPALLERPRTVLGRATPLVGRERELRSIEDIAADCFGEAIPTAVLLIGDPGVGKSRLRHELIQRLGVRHADLRVWSARAAPFSSASALALIGALVRHAAAVPAGEAAPLQRARLAECVERSVPAADRARVLAFLAELIGVAGPDDEGELGLARVNPQHLMSELRRGWEDFGAAAAKSAPLLVTLEDLHWADAASLRYLDALLRREAGRRTLVLATARPELRETHPTLWSGRRLNEVRLEPLARAAAEELVRHVLGDRGGEQRRRRVVEQAAGNPFYLEELIRAVAEGRSGELPGSVVAMVHARLDALPAPARRVLRAASVFGETFWRNAVGALTGAGVDVGDELSRLADQEIVERRVPGRFAREDEYAFRHALLREGAYALLGDDDRRAGHAHAGRWLDGAGETDAVVLAGHFERGGDAERAIDEYFKAARRMVAVHDVAQAGACADGVIRCGADGEARARARLLQCDAGMWTGDFGALVALADDALSLAAPGSRVFARALGVKVLAAFHHGDGAELSPAAAVLLTTLAPLDAHVSLLTATSNAVLCLYAAGDFALAERVELEHQRMAGAAPPMVGAALSDWVSGFRAYYRDAHGDEAVDAPGRAAAAMSSFGSNIFALNLRAEQAMALAALGSWQEAEASCLAALDQLGDDAPSHFRAYVEAVLCLCAWRAGDHRLTVERSEALAGVTSGRGVRSMEAFARWLHAEVRCARDEPAEAAEAAEASIAVAAAFPVVRCLALSVLAAARWREGRRQDALAASERALALCAAPSRAGFFEPTVRARRAELLAAAGHAEEARAAQVEGRARLEAIAATLAASPRRDAFLALREHRTLAAR